jgi:hypothetical protein
LLQLCRTIPTTVGLPLCVVAQSLLSRPADLLAVLALFNDSGQRVLFTNVVEALISLFRPPETLGGRLRLVRASKLANLARVLRRLKPEM